MLDLPQRDERWRLLEVGTGSGGIAHYIATHPRVRCDVTSVDVVDVRTVVDAYAFVRVDGTRLPFPDGAFDAVVTNHVIEHVGDADAQLAHLRECARVLAPGGHGYLAVPNRWMVVEPHFRLPFLSWLPKHFRDTYVRIAGKGTHYDCEPLTIPQIERMLGIAGIPFTNCTIRALRETLAIEGTSRPAHYIATSLPDGFWRMMLRIMPTLIYCFGEGFGSADAVPHQ